MKYPSKHTSFLLLSIFTATFLTAQLYDENEPPCAYDLLNQTSTTNINVPSNFSKSIDGDFIIPVVVHIIHNNGSENISDAQILSGIEEMNSQFAGDEGGTDGEIEFRLATIDPDGNCTTGINRIQHPSPAIVLQGGSPCGLTDFEKRQLIQWPTLNYMNIWVVAKIWNSAPSSCDYTSSGIRGYANSQGCTVRYDYFGTIEEALYSQEISNVNTDTHEAGHYLGLSHPFVGSSCSFSCETAIDSDCNFDGDKVCDTAPCNGPVSVVSCDLLPLSCTACPSFDFTGYVYPKDNYMSYNTQCHYRFTPGQIDRMHGVIEAHPILQNLFTESNLSETGTSDFVYNSLLQVSASINEASCQENVSDGSISLTVSGGSDSYSYIWNTGATTSSITGLSGGWYSVLVSDDSSNDCISSLVSFYVPSPYLSYTMEYTCVQSQDGEIDITVFDANDNVLVGSTYLWNDLVTTEDRFNLPAGEYSVTVTTPSNCVLEQDFNLLFKQRPIIDHEDHIEIIDATCESLGSIFTEITSFGTPQEFIYNWTDSQENTISSSQHFENVIPGTYFLSVTNPNTGCTSAVNEFVVGLTELCCSYFDINISSSDVCPSYENGTISVIATGGIEPYSYSWTHDTNETESELSGLEVGTYQVTVTDAQGCELTEFISIEYDTSVPAMNMSLSEVIVNTDTDWPAGEYGFLENLVIENAGVVDISPGATLRFAPNAGIIVESGGMLIMNGATLTRFECNPNFWQGIDVHDDGTVLTWDSFAEFALIGINNYDRSSGPANTAGGNISCWTTEFTDCQSAVRLRKKNGTSSYSSLASFRDCDFTWTNNLPYVNSFFPQPLIDSKESTVNFVYCDFTNENDELLSLTINHTHNPAIYSYLTRLTVIGDDASSMRNKMTGFRHGIVQHGGRAYVDQMDFNNFRSAYVVSSKGSRFTQNNFGILSETRLPLIVIDTDDFAYKTMYGLYLESSTAYWVEDNEFFLAWPDQQDPYGTPPTIPDFPYTAGLFVRGSGPAQNQIYRNRFYYNDNASIAYDDNRNEDPSDASGLKYTCNEFYYNDNGVNVVSTVNDYNPGWGIHASQGVAPNFPAEGISAGNYFEGQTINDVRNDGNLAFFTYYWHQNDTEGFTQLETEGNLSAPTFQIQSYGACESRLTRSRSSRSASADLDKQAAEQLRLQYNLLVDGGDTEGLLSEVVLTQYGEALELYYELMSKSPHISEEVMIEAIQKETELPAALLTLILESNPQAAKSKEVEKKLDDRLMPLEEYQRYMIEQGKYLLSDKEILEARIAYHESEQHAALDEIIIDIMMDSTIVEKRTEIEAEVSGRESLDIRYLRIDLAIEEGDMTAAQALLDAIPNDLPLRGLKEPEYLDFVSSYEMLIYLLDTESTTLTQSQEDELYLIAVKRATRASGMAQIMLMEYGDYLFDEVLVDPESTAKSRRNWNPRKPKFSIDPSLNIYPNPASDHIVIEFRNWGEQVSLQLNDAVGKNIRDEFINSSNTAYILDFTSLSEGTYSLLLRSMDGQQVQQRQIEVLR